MVAFGATDAEIHLETDALTLDGYTIEQTCAEVQTMAESARAKGFGDRVYAHRGISMGSIETLQTDRLGKPICNHSNVVALLTKHPDWENVFVNDAFDRVKLRVLFSDEYFGDQLPHMASKDASSYLKGKWGVELAELDFKRKTEVETIKAFISRLTENYLQMLQWPLLSRSFRIRGSGCKPSVRKRRIVLQRRR